MKTETLLLIAGAVGVGYLIHKARAKAALVTTPPPGSAPMIAAKALPEENAEVIFVEPAVEYYPAWGAPWGGPWGGSWGRGGGRRHRHRGGRRR